MEAVECGAAALGIVLGYYGRLVPLADLRQACGVSRDGSIAANILRAAQGYGLMARGFSMTLEALWELPCPYVVFWNFNHFVVVEGRRGSRVFINDPATGPRPVTLEEFDQGFTGVVLVMEPGPQFTPGGRQPSPLHALRAWLRGSGAALLYCLLAGGLMVIPGLAVPVLTQVFVDQVLIAGLQDWLRPLLIGMLLTAVCRGLLLRLQLQALRRLRLKLATVMSSRFLWHLLHLPVSFYTQRYAGEISHRLQLTDSIADALSGRLATTVIEASLMLVYSFPT
jgi:ABC-type bacteriocin/lantibiotic exporter with double-glycine peptidase domain